MSESIAPLSYEGILEMFRQSTLEFNQRLQEFDRQRKESALEFDRRWEKLERQMEITDKQIERTSKEVSSLSSSIGEIVENMVGGDIDKQFQALGYNVTAQSRNKIFGAEGTKEWGEIDLLLEDGDVAILIEAKTTLKTKDILEHIERLEKYRAYLNKTGKADHWQLVGAVAAASAHPEVVKFAQRQGLYVIIQTGRMVEIVTPPEGFVAKRW